ncbi:MAG: SLC13 family permease [Thermomicrobiales bacterium]
MTDRIWEVLVLPASRVVGRTLRDTGLGAGYGVSVIATVRAGSTSAVSRTTAPIEAGDILLIGGRGERVRQIAERSNLELIGTPRSVSRFPLSEAELVEVIVPPRSDVVGQTLRELDFRNEHDLTVVAIWHAGRPIRTDVAEHRLTPGDSLLLYGRRSSTRAFQPRPELFWMNPPPEEEAPEELRHLAPVSALILLGVIVVASLGLMNVGVAALAGAAATILFGVLTPQQAYERVGWSTVILIAGMFPLGIALRNSGGADFISENLIDLLQPYGTVAILGGVALMTMLLTQPIHNAAVAVIMTPVAIDVAARLDSNPHAFAAAVIIAASANFLLPVGHPAPLLVQGPGRYATADYLKFGIGLCLVAMLIVILVVPVIWPL